eukprot:494355_1
MIDDGETDWKVVVIRCDGPQVAQLNDINDIPEKKLKQIFEWFRDYKSGPDGKGPKNEFSNNNHPYNKAEAIKIIEETHDAWRELRGGELRDKCYKINTLV